MDRNPVDDQFRQVAEINQRPIYFPNEVGMARLKWVWGILSVIGGFLIISTWTIAIKSGNWDREIGAKMLAESNKRDIDGRKQTYDEMVKFYGSLSHYDFHEWYEQHRGMYEMMVRGESNRARFYREKGYPAPELPEGPK